jgi:CRISPR system Cascade subunit CasC
MKIELHIIQNVAPSNLNRDDTGAPKDAEFGGVRRARLSSQSLKRAMREAFVLPSDMGLGKAVRTLQLVTAVDDILKESRGSAEIAMRHKAIHVALAAAGIKVDAEKNATQYLLFLPARSATQIAQLVDAHWDVLSAAEISGDGKKKGKSADSSLSKELVNALKNIMKEATATPEIALFGRMVADEPTWNVDAACQVAHALSVNRVSSEFDFFTAVDDLKQDTGAGMMGTVQFGSSTFYRYLVVDVDAYMANLADHKSPYSPELKAVARASLAAFIEVAVKALPSGKQNTFAAHNLPSLVMAVVRSDAPVSLTNAFLKPVMATNEYDLADAAIIKLDTYFGQLTKAYGTTHIQQIQTLVVNPDVKLANIVTNNAQVDDLATLIAGTLDTCFGGAS